MALVHNHTTLEDENMITEKFDIQHVTLGGDWKWWKLEDSIQDGMAMPYRHGH